jgi:heptosyltransferase III
LRVEPPLRTEPLHRPPRRILVLTRPFLGDQILCRPVFQNLREWAPGASIVAGIHRDSTALATIHPEVDRVLALPRRRPGTRRQLLADWLRTFVDLRREAFDLVVDLSQNDRSALITVLSLARKRATFVQAPRRIRHLGYSHRARWSSDELRSRHMADLYLKPLEELGVPLRIRDIRMELAPAEEARARERLRELYACDESPLIIVHPGASHDSKCWPLEDFAAVCDEIQHRHRVRVLFLGGAREQEALADLRRGMKNPGAILTEVLPLRDLAAVLEQGDLFLGNDSGPMQLAAAVGTRVVGLFGASDLVQWRPIGDRHRVLQPPMPCDGCVAPGLCQPPDPYKMHCVRRLGRAEVLDALERQLKPGGASAIPAERSLDRAEVEA